MRLYSPYARMMVRLTQPVQPQTRDARLVKAAINFSRVLLPFSPASYTAIAQRRDYPELFSDHQANTPVFVIQRLVNPTMSLIRSLPGVENVRSAKPTTHGVIFLFDYQDRDRVSPVPGIVLST